MWLDIIKSLVDFTDRRSALKAAQRERLSTVFSDISNLLNDVAEEMENGIYPLGSCFAMTTLCEELLDNMRGIVDDKQIQELSPVLYNASRLEREYANRQDPQTLETLREAAGHFHAKSIIFKL